MRAVSVVACVRGRDARKSESAINISVRMIRTSIVGPSVPMMVQLPCGPLPTTSTGRSIRSRSWYVPGSSITTSYGLARESASLIVRWLPGCRPRGSTMCVMYLGDGEMGTDDMILSAKRRSFCVCPPSRVLGIGMFAEAISWRQPLDHESRRANSCFQFSGSRSAFGRR